MTKSLSVSVGQYSDSGKKPENQDFHGIYIPEEPLLSSKGVAIAIADGISSSNVSQIASQAAVTSFLDDYYATSDAWSVKTSAIKVLRASNSWLHAQSRNSPDRFNKDKGYICTFSGLVIKSRTAHIFHCGDTRIYHLSSGNLEQLTTDHRHSVSAEVNYLTRALGIHDAIEVDYSKIAVEEGDIFILSTDGVHEYISEQKLKALLSKKTDELDTLAKNISLLALEGGSTDNLTLQILRVNTLPDLMVGELHQQIATLAIPPKLEPRIEFDGFKILRDIYISSRSHVYLAEDIETKEIVAIKTPSTELKNDTRYLESFLMEEWIAMRINNPHVLKAIHTVRKRNYLYTVTEYIEGQTLSQWMIDNPEPKIEQVRDIIEQIATGIQAFHRQEMIHQDLRPNNIMIDKSGIVKIIDFGSTKVAGIADVYQSNEGIVGTMQYSAPEYFVHDVITNKVDIYSLGVITYQMFCGKLPYGNKVSSAKTKTAQLRLNYSSLQEQQIEIPQWIDDAIRKALNINPLKRYYEISEFVYDLRNPNKSFLSRNKKPLIERDPVGFWRIISVFLMLIIIFQAMT